jgi:hypothetical protein
MAAAEIVMSLCKHKVFNTRLRIPAGFQLPAKQVKPPRYPATSKRPNFIYILVDDQG